MPYRGQTLAVPSLHSGLPQTPFFCYLALTLPKEAVFMKLAGSLLLLLFCFVAMPQKAQSQTPSASPAPSAVQAAPQTQTTEYTLPPDKLEKAKALYDLRGTLRIIDTFY